MTRSANLPAANRLLAEAETLVRDELIRRARTVLAGRNPARSFCMAMGTASFYDHRGDPIDEWTYGPFGRSGVKRYLSPFYRLLDEYDCRLRLTGNPAKLDSATGPIITDW